MLHYFVSPSLIRINLNEFNVHLCRKNKSSSKNDSILRNTRQRWSINVAKRKLEEEDTIELSGSANDSLHPLYEASGHFIILLFKRYNTLSSQFLIYLIIPNTHTLNLLTILFAFLILISNKKWLPVIFC